MRRVFVVLIAAFGCAGFPAHGDELAPKGAAAGRKLYVAKCAKCHKFYEPRNYNETDWQRWMELMSRKAKLKTDQNQLLRQYLDEYRAGRVPKAR
jgi:cytochrome c5